MIPPDSCDGLRSLRTSARSRIVGTWGAFDSPVAFDSLGVGGSTVDSSGTAGRPSVERWSIAFSESSGGLLAWDVADSRVVGDSPGLADAKMVLESSVKEWLLGASDRSAVAWSTRGKVI